MITVKTLSVAKFGGSLLSEDGKNIPKILKCIIDLKNKSDFGPIVVFSAPNGFTDKLLQLGEACTQSDAIPICDIFNVYEKLAKNHIKGDLLKHAINEMKNYRRQLDDSLALVTKRFHGTIKAKILTHGGELPTSVLMDYILRNKNIDSCHIKKEQWPIITDDKFESATPNYLLSKKRLTSIIQSLQEGKIIVIGGFLGITNDGLETILGRGGSDLSAVFLSCLLKEKFDVETVLFKQMPVQSADPKKVKNQKTEHLLSLTYNEAHKASKMGMKIVQGEAISMAKSFEQSIKVMSLVDSGKFTIIQSGKRIDQTVKCVTGKSGCAILTMNDRNSRSFEDALRIWENCNDFIDLGTETLETGKRIRDFLFLDSNFLRKNEERLKGFDQELKIEYGVGVVTLIGDGMKYSSGIASIAIGAIPQINIKRGIFAPHTSQIILAVEENEVSKTVAAIHSKRNEMNKSKYRLK